VALLAARRDLALSPTVRSPQYARRRSALGVALGQDYNCATFRIATDDPCFSTEQCRRMEKPRGR